MAGQQVDVEVVLDWLGTWWEDGAEVGVLGAADPHGGELVGDGQLVHSDLDSRVVGINPETLRAIPRRIGLAGGTRKHDAIRAALTGNWVNVL
ncbi:MAG TPA: sugar-binding domain-containing protein, partial [Microlunatus sp.]